MRRREVLTVPLTFLTGLAGTLVTRDTRAQEPGTLPEQAREALRKSTAFMRSISTEGGYLWRYSEDLKERSGENRATATQVWVQSPGTPAMGMAFLRAYEVTRDPQYLQAAGAAARALAIGQLQSGGWDYLIDFDPRESRKWYWRTDAGQVPEAEAARRRNQSTFDDDNTQGAIRFLIAYDGAAKVDDPQLRDIRAALDYALGKMREAQYPNGAWPQRYDGKPRDAAKYPVRSARIPDEYPREYSKEAYYDRYTLNDNTQRDCIRTMLLAHHRLGKPEYLASAKRGGDFLVLAQLPAPQPAWAQQYNSQMEPAWARAFEPPAVCSAESAGAIRTLVDLYHETGDEKYLKPIPAALDWFSRSQIAPGTWARIYELGTNKPIYGDRDGKIHYTLEELSEERRKGYAWRSAFGVEAAIKAYEDAKKNGPRRPAQAERGERPGKDRLGALERDSRQAIQSLDDRGRWLVNGRIETRAFIQNTEALCDYLAVAGS